MNDTEYRNWLTALKARYHAAQVKAAVSVNGALIEFYWALGRDIEERFGENEYGSGFFEKLSADLCVDIPNVKGISPNNLRYSRHFYRLYQNLPQLVGELMKVPWSSHRLIGEFMPEHVGQLGFYMTAVDRQVKNPWDKPTVGLVLCRKGDRTIIEYALNMTQMPMGVGKYTLTQDAPMEINEMQASLARLPTVVDATLTNHASTKEI